MLYQAWSTDPVAMWNNVECDQQEYEINQRTVHAERPPTHFRQYNKNLLVRAQWYTMIVCSTLYTVQFRLSNSHFPTHQINGLNRAGADWSVHSCRRRWSEAACRVGPAIPIWKVCEHFRHFCIDAFPSFSPRPRTDGMETSKQATPEKVRDWESETQRIKPLLLSGESRIAKLAER